MCIVEKKANVSDPCFLVKEGIGLINANSLSLVYVAVVLVRVVALLGKLGLLEDAGAAHFNRSVHARNEQRDREWRE